MTFTTIFWNAGAGWWSDHIPALLSYFDYLSSLHKSHPSFIGIAEARIPPHTSIPHLPNYTCYPSLSSTHRGNGGLCYCLLYDIIRRDAPSSLITQYSASIFCILPGTTQSCIISVLYHRVKDKNSWSIINNVMSHALYGRDIDVDASGGDASHHHNDRMVFFMGDFNARHRSWGDSVIDTHGISIHEFCLDNNLSILNCSLAFGKFTFPSTPSILDLIITNRPHLQII